LPVTRTPCEWYTPRCDLVKGVAVKASPFLVRGSQPQAFSIFSLKFFRAQACAEITGV